MLGLQFAQKFKQLEKLSNQNYWSKRIYSEMLCLNSVSKFNGNKFETRIEDALDFLLTEFERDKALTMSAVRNAEKMLADLSPEVKKYRGICVSHAHIDMNWMWGYQETAAVTVDTFRTVLDLMKEYPDFTFSQSQASVYKIIERHAPYMIPEIKQSIHKGRWELSSSTWVETDKNMPNGESLSRHILYTKRYLSQLFEIEPDSIRLDFEPDTFGHNLNVPEILQNGGVDYYYHCRGFNDYNIYNWISPSGKSILCYREPKWYNSSVEYDTFCDMPLFCDKHGIDTFLYVYGVGDHGGGPTRRDIERIIDIASWPLIPTLKFGTYHEFFDYLKERREQFPTVDTELNFLFTGCYSSQTRIKMSNRISEDRAYEAEQISAMADALTESGSRTELFGTAWENILFNQFHDILPGSGTIETREYALGKFQDTLATLNTCANKAMRDIANQIDTSSIDFEDDNLTYAEGGGVGYEVGQSNSFKFPSAERGRGKTRAFHLFNSTMYDRDEPTEVTIWDYSGDINCAYVTDTQGNEVPYTLQISGKGHWGHSYCKLLVKAKVPAFGYATYILREREMTDFGCIAPCGVGRVDSDINDNNPVLENDRIRAEFDSATLQLVLLVDKESGDVLVNAERPSCVFRLIKENPRFGMTSWRVGPYMNIETLNLTQNVRLTDYSREALRQFISYEIEFGASKLEVTVTLTDGSPLLEFGIKVDWHELSSDHAFIPQLNFYVPVAYSAKSYKYDIPFGIIERQPIAHDVPANSFMQIINAQGMSVSVVTDTKYGFRGNENSGAVTLIRSSWDPDQYPELGIHYIRIGVAVSCTDCMKAVASKFCHPISAAAGTKHGGSLAPVGQLFSFEDAKGIMTSAVKNAEDGGIILRVSELDGQSKELTVKFCKPVKFAALTDINEKADLGGCAISGDRVTFNVPAYGMATVLIK